MILIDTFADMVIIIVIFLVITFLIDPPIARKIVVHYNWEIKLLDYNKHKHLAIFITYISLGLIAIIIYASFTILFGYQFINKYDYLIVALICFLWGTIYNIYLIQSSPKR